MSPVFRRESEYTFKIYSNEEERMHIHVIYEGKEAKFWLQPEVELAKNTGIPEHKLNEIRKIVERYADKFKEQFREHKVCVMMINAQGIMLSVQGQDYFLSYNRIPWMQDAPIRSVLNVQMSGPESIEWPDLDVDLEIESLRHPERYPLVIKRNALDFVRG